MSQLTVHFQKLTCMSGLIISQNTAIISRLMLGYIYNKKPQGKEGSEGSGIILAILHLLEFSIQECQALLLIFSVKSLASPTVDMDVT